MSTKDRSPPSQTDDHTRVTAPPTDGSGLYRQPTPLGHHPCCHQAYPHQTRDERRRLRHNTANSRRTNKPANSINPQALRIGESWRERSVMDDEVQVIDYTGKEILRSSDLKRSVTSIRHSTCDILFHFSIKLNGYAVIGGDPPRDLRGPGRRVEVGGDREGDPVIIVPHRLTPLINHRSADPFRSGLAYGVGRDIYTRYVINDRRRG